MLLHHLGVVAVDCPDGERAGARQLARLCQGPIPGRGARVKVLSDLVGNTFEFMHGHQYGPRRQARRPGYWPVSVGGCGRNRCSASEVFPGTWMSPKAAS